MIDTRADVEVPAELGAASPGVESAHGSTIELRGASKVYGDQIAVHPVDLEIKAGEFMTFLGPSGSGKTTTLNMIAGFVDLTDGALEVGGREMSRVPAHRRGIGMVFQHYALFPHMNVETNVAFPLAQRRVPRAQQRSRVRAALKTVRLEDYGKRYPSELSGGQQQRVALARALVFEPGVLLMDEPLGALDRKLREWLQIELKRIHREVKTTFVYVTHDQEEALALSDRIAVFHDGFIEQVGTGVELYEAPRTLFVGRFIGESTVLRGSMAARGVNPAVRLKTGELIAVGKTLPEGAASAVLIRPEGLELVTRVDDVRAGFNSVRVEVLEQTYLGAEWRYDVRLPDGEHGVVRQGKENAVSFAPGEQAYLAWDPAAGVLLEDDGTP